MKPVKSRLEIYDKCTEMMAVYSDTVKCCFCIEDKEKAHETACMLDGMRLAFNWIMNEDNDLQSLDKVLKECAEKYDLQKYIK